MTAITEGTDFFVMQGLPNMGIKQLFVSTVTTAEDTNTIEVDLSDYGCNALLGIIGFEHTTANSVVVQEQPTTTMSGATLTITVGGSSATGPRHYWIFAASTDNP